MLIKKCIQSEIVYFGKNEFEGNVYLIVEYIGFDGGDLFLVQMQRYWSCV